MTWARTLATGSGALAFRLSLDGLKEEAVTDPAMEATVSGRVRSRGLKRDGLGIDERVDIAAAKLDLTGITAHIVDYGLIWTAALAKSPTVATWLTADLTAAATSVSLASTGGLSNGDEIYVGTETILIGTVGSPCTGCTRGAYNSQAQAHYIADGARARYPAVTNRPRSLRGRRARLYAYGNGESMTGNGTQVFLGRCSTNAETSGGMTEYTLKIDPISTILRQDLGENLDDEVEPRGIYYPWNMPLMVTLELSSDATIGGSTASGPTTVQVVGFYETQAAFVTALQALITTATSGWATTVSIEALGDDGWRFLFRTGATAKFVRTYVAGELDVEELALATDASGTWLGTGTMSANTTYYRNVAAPVPRGFFGQTTWRGPPLAPALDTSLRDTWPEDRIYVGSDTALDATTMSAAAVTWPDGSTRTYSITSVDATTRSIVLRYPRFRPVISVVYGTEHGLPSIKFSTAYSAGSFTAFLNALGTLAPTYMNLGSVPDIRITGTALDDIDMTAAADSTATIIAIAEGSNPCLTTRNYTSYSPRKLEDIVAAEAQIRGCYWGTNSVGQLALKLITLPTAGSGSSATIGHSDILADQGFGSWESAAFGTLNTVRFLTGYDGAQDKHLGSPIVVRDVDSLGIDKTVRAIKVEPVFEPVEEAAGSIPGTYVAAGQTLLGVFGGPYATIEIDVALTAFAHYIGDVIALTHAQIPNPDTGVRGVTARPCMILGRKWDFKTGRGRLTLLTTTTRVAGYTPSMRIVSESGSGTAWTLTLSNTDAAVGTINYNPDSDCSVWFPVGSVVRVYIFDTTAPTTRTGTVTGATATTLSVTFTAAWTPGADAWMLRYGVAGDVLTAAQEAYSYMTGTDMVINFSSGDVGARVFGP